MAWRRLVFNGGMNVDVEALRDDGEKFIIYSVLAKLRPGPRGALYQALLEANLPTENGGAGVLALDVERDEIASENSRRYLADRSLSL